MRLRYPAANGRRVVEYPKLTGGLNLRELEYRLPPDQSPDMRNLWWENGVLQSRDGQKWLNSDTARGQGYTCWSELFWDNAFFHIGGKLYYGQPNEEGMELKELCDGVPENRGTFFRYLDWLFYKNRGGFFRIEYLPQEEVHFKVVSVPELAHVPVVAINSDPVTGGGDLYQPENRLSADKILWYNAKKDTKDYKLPVGEIDSVVEVKVDEEVKKEGDDYQVDLKEGKVTFTTAPPVTTPSTNNTVKITYRKADPEAVASIMDCTYAMVAGGMRSICILLAGSTKQPNAVFWNSNDELSMDPGYFPMTAYNLVGDTEDPVSGFGRQYSDTIVLKEHSVGKLDFSLDEVNGRKIPLFTYTSINNKVGCDLPWTVQLIENNLVFCNTYQGVHVIQSSSAAYENNVECISLNVNGDGKNGLLRDVRAEKTAVSWDDDNRYWLCANGHAYLWDYLVSSMEAPCWYYQTELAPVCFFRDGANVNHHMDAQGRVTRMGRYFSDYGEGIDKVYRFPTTNFGTYDRLKDVVEVDFATRSDTMSNIQIRYDTDYESRYDRTELSTWQKNCQRLALGETILGYYNLEMPRYAVAAKRRPGCRHVRHFSMTLSNREPGADLAIVSARIYYRIMGKER